MKPAQSKYKIKDQELRHRAAEIACMLPHDAADARQVLRLAGEIVDNFLAAPDEAPPPTLVAIKRGDPEPAVTQEGAHV